MKRIGWVPASIYTAMVLPALLLAPTAQADPVTDSLFIQVISEQGITYTSEAAAITAGHAVCDYRGMGFSEIQTAAMVYRNSSLNSYDSGYFVGAAEGSFCPWFYEAGSTRLSGRFT